MSSRVENSKKNIKYGFAGKLVQLFTKFLLRTALIYYLGAVYIGLDGLFLNVISVLSITELGIGSAVCFALYKPLEEGDESKLCAYMKFYRNVYLAIGLIILAAGTMITPLLGYIINFPVGIALNYKLMYYLFLINTVTTYLCGSYKQMLFTADQKSYVNTNVTNAVYLGTAALQILVIIITKNYYFYLFVMILGNIFTNLYLSHMVTKKYPCLSAHKEASLSREDKISLRKNVYALAVTKISTVIYTSSDNLVISGLIGTVVVGYYSNYAYIISAVTGMIAIIFSSMLASVGNAYVTESREAMHQIYKRVSYINVWVYGTCFTCFLCLLQDFIRLWAGEGYLLDYRVMAVVALMFLTQGLHHTTTIFKDACGLFWQTRYRTVATAVLNIISSVILVHRIGLSGCFLGTMIAYFLTTFLVDPGIIYREVFGRQNGWEFYVWYGKNLLFILFIAVLFAGMSKWIFVNTWLVFFVKALCCFVFVNAAYFFALGKREEFQYVWRIVKRAVLRRM